MLTVTDLRRASPEAERRLLQPRRTEAAPEVEGAVRLIVERVRREGDAALFALTKEHDGVDLTATGIAVPPKHMANAAHRVDPDLRNAIDAMIERLRDLHGRQLIEGWRSHHAGLERGEIVRPLRRVGCYVPGGKASYPSTAAMTVVPARTAGVEEIVVCTPPRRGEELPAELLYAAQCAGATEVLTLGGAQAIGALAYGTESIAPVDKIVGPGNVYVTAAKRLVSGDVGIDGLAGPTELVIVADETADAGAVAADLIAQAEHDPMAVATLVTTDDELVSAVNRQLEVQLGDAARRDVAVASLRNARVLVVEDEAAATRVVNAIAPEHLQIIVRTPEAVLEGVRNAGAVFLGPWTPVPFGDYGVGSNHVLPTSGTARFASGLRTSDFLKVSSVVRLDPAAARDLAPEVARLARAEGFDGHARAVEIRSELAAASEHQGRPARSEGAPRPAAEDEPAPAPSPRPGLREVEAYQAPQLDVPVRLNTNECPYPLPDGFGADLAAAVRDLGLNRYPDREATALRSALAERMGHPLEGLWVANGSNEIIEQLLLAYGGNERVALLFEPTYVLHRNLAWLTHTECATVDLDPPFAVTPEHVESALRRHPDVVFVCSPNNPTGGARPPEMVEELARRSRALVIVDEAYVEFGGKSAAPLVATYPNVVVIRTFSKAFALAGARIGYCLASPEVVEDLRRVRLPYHLSSLAQAAGLVALAYAHEAMAILDAIRRERDRLVTSLARMPGVTVYPSDANFVLFRPPGSAPDVWRALLEKGVLVRDLSSVVAGCLRVSAGTPDEVDRFLDALDEVLS